MPKRTNIEITNEVLADTTILKSVIPAVENQADMEALHGRISAYPNDKNEFYTSLYNKVAKTLVNERSFESPLRELEKGKLLFGEGIENIFVEFLTSKKYDETKHFTGHESSAEDLIKGMPPKMRIEHLTKNFDREYKTSISDAELRKAFYNADGMTRLSQKILGNLQSSANRDMYKDMKQILVKSTDASDTMDDNGTNFGKGVIKRAEECVANKASLFYKLPAEGTIKDRATELAIKCREFSDGFMFPSTAHTLTASLESFTYKTDLVFITIPEYNSLMDVHVMANAFNASSADVQAKTILVDDLGTSVGAEGTTATKVVGILCDRNLIQYWIISELLTTFTNAERKNMQNFFNFREGVAGINPFAQFVIFLEG